MTVSRRLASNAISYTSEVKGPLLASQSSIPSLPVPTLDSTAYKYLESARPHLSESQYKSTQSTVKEFLASPLVKKLQDRLHARASENGVNGKNWLIEWWNEAAYMGYRDSVVVNVSYFYLHTLQLGEAWKEGMGGSKKAALLLKAMLQFRKLVETQQLQPDKLKTGPLCMESYKWLFNACRYPTEASDTARKFAPDSHNHIIFIRNNRFYEVNTQVGENGEITLHDLEAQIEQIKSLASKRGKAPSIGVLTSENRDTWTEARKSVVASSLNARSLERIESAIMIVALDESSPSTNEEASWTMWVGDGRNRFYDKHQLIVCDNGLSGFLGEHSCMDGTPTLRMNEFILGSVASGKILPEGSSVPTGSKALEAPKELEFEINNKVEGHIKEAEKNFDALVGGQELEYLQYTTFGADLAKKHGVSPDAVAQMIKQLAFYKLYKRPGVCYESAQTRRFQFGRTEVLRAASNESKAWVGAMIDSSRSAKERFNLFHKAATRHIQYATWAAAGQGVDRHLFGLKKVLKEGEETPELYKDAAFGMTNHWELSTSQLSSPFFDGWGYGEVVPDGYGLSYAIGPGYFRWIITCRTDNKVTRYDEPWQSAAKLKKALTDAADEVQRMMVEGHEVVPKSKM